MRKEALEKLKEKAEKWDRVVHLSALTNCLDCPKELSCGSQCVFLIVVRAIQNVKTPESEEPNPYEYAHDSCSMFRSCGRKMG